MGGLLACGRVKGTYWKLRAKRGSTCEGFGVILILGRVAIVYPFTVGLVVS